MFENYVVLVGRSYEKINGSFEKLRKTFEGKQKQS